ncbi:hypothetical protein FACS1894176_02330 [Bacteroidia bacterium]|nr:hypothetical protein FACS1894176_02330 [Bacteroidia bacterium]
MLKIDIYIISLSNLDILSSINNKMSEKLKSSRENTKKRGKRLLPIAALAGVLYECDKLVPTAEERLASNIKESEKSLYIPRSLSAEQQKEYDRYIHFFSANEVSAEMPQELLQQ